MSVIQDSEYVLYKAAAQQVKECLVRPLNAINLKCLKELSKFEKQKALFLNCETFEDLGDNSKKLKNNLRNLFLLVAVQDRLEKIIDRNEQRIDFVSLKLQQMGIYNDAVDKKLLSKTLSAESKNISKESLNLNPKLNGGVTFKFFNGQILAFRDNELDFDLDENREVLISGSADFIHSVVETFPYSVGTIPDEYYLSTDLKNKILKECVLYVASKIKTQTIAESNKQLGGLLEKAGELTSIVHFADELRNYFNVIVKQTLRTQSPEFEEEINSSLKCNESSIFLPELRRVVGVVVENEDDIEDVSEKEDEVKKESAEEQVEESEDNEEDGMSSKELLNLLMDDEDDLDEEVDESEGSVKTEDDDDIDNILGELSSLFGDDEETGEQEKQSTQEIVASETANSAEELVDDGKSIDEDIDNILKDLEDLFASEDEDKNED